MIEAGKRSSDLLAVPAKRLAAAVVLAVVLAGGLTGCGAQAVRATDPATPETQASAAVVKSGAPTPRSLKGPKVADSFGNVDFYTTAAGDTHAALAAAFGISEAKIAAFNGLTPGAPLVPGTKLRLIPPAGPMAAATGTASVDAAGIPRTYIVSADDTLDGITYRFGITEEQLAEANKVPFVHEQGNVYFLHPGQQIELQKKPVDSRSGTGKTVNNSFGRADFYTTVDGDSLDSLGYRFRSTTRQLLLYNPGLKADRPIPAGTRVRLMPGDLKIEGAQGTATASADGVPVTYTMAAGDVERQVAFRFNLRLDELESANRPLTPGTRTWIEFTDLPSGELKPGQTISLTLDQPITK
jgi:LysM repeat protein/phage tail protein X